MNNRHYTFQVFITSLYLSVAATFMIHSSVFAAWNPEDVLESFLINNYPWEDVEVTNVKILGRKISSPPERIIVEKGPLGRAVFSFISSGSKRTIVKADVRAFGKVVKSRRPFRKRHVVQNDDIYLARMDIRKMPNSAVKDPSRILGKSLRRSISANIPIGENMIEMSRSVPRGKRVMLILSSNGFSIRVAGKTREKGYVGMYVRAINLSSKKEVNGVLIDENTIRVGL